MADRYDHNVKFSGSSKALSQLGYGAVHLAPGAVHKDQRREQAAHASEDGLQDLAGDPRPNHGGADHDELEDGDRRHCGLEGRAAAARSAGGRAARFISQHTLGHST